MRAAHALMMHMSETSLLDVYRGAVSWRDYLRRNEIEGSAAEPSATGRLRGALTSVHLDLEKLSGGLDRLNADFNLVMGDLLWKHEMRQETLSNILEEIRLAEFEREARAYRTRAERAYVNGWYEEALLDFLEAEKRNYPDFAVLRSIATIYLYHLIDLPNSLRYFEKAAKYARPSDARHAAEAHFFAGIVCALELKFVQAQGQLEEAISLNHRLYEAYYQRAGLAALLGDPDTALARLEPAIKGDPGYFERAASDPLFDDVRPQVQQLLDALMRPVKQKIAEVSQEVRLRAGYVVARPEEQEIAVLFKNIERRVVEAKTYKGGIEFLEALSQVQHQLNAIYHLFYKHHHVDLNDYVRSVAFSPDGRLVAAGFLNGGVKVWDVYTGMTVLSFEAHLASVNSVAFSPDSQWLVSGSRDKTIKLWDSTTGSEIQTLLGHPAEVRAVAFSPDGEWLVSGSHDRTVRLWRAATGQQVQIIGTHKLSVTATLFSPNGRIVASAGMDKTVKLWDATGGKEIRILRGHTRGVEAIAFGPDGNVLASGARDRRIKIWDVGGRELKTLNGVTSDVTSLSFSPDGSLLAAGSLGKMVKVWRLAEGEVIKSLRSTEIGYNPVAFSPEGHWLALGSRDLQLWLKAVLTEQEHAAVKAGEERALLLKKEEGPHLHLAHRIEARNHSNDPD